MKYIPILMIFLSCCKQPAEVQFKERTVFKHDTVYIHKPYKVVKIDTVYVKDQKETDSLKTKLFIANYKMERVKYYLKICLRNPKQDRFLKGWINRAVN
jgi:hypothetical protein